MGQLKTFESEVELPEHISMDSSESVVELRSDEFREIPATGESPDIIYISQTHSGHLDVRPVGVGGERMEVTAREAINYLEEMFI